MAFSKVTTNGGGVKLTPWFVDDSHKMTSPKRVPTLSSKDTSRFDVLTVEGTSIMTAAI